MSEAAAAEIRFRQEDTKRIRTNIVNPKLLLHCQFRVFVSHTLKTTVSDRIICRKWEKRNLKIERNGSDPKLVLQSWVQKGSTRSYFCNQPFQLFSKPSVTFWPSESFYIQRRLRTLLVSVPRGKNEDKRQTKRREKDES